MTAEQVRYILNNHTFPGQSAEAELVETHISWLILTNKYAFKIKKPIQYSFLDFSTAEKRQYYCRREVALNQRLAKGMYLDVVPVTRSGEEIRLDGKKGEIIDHAVRMNRMDNSRQMNLLLEKEEVSFQDMEKLAAQLAAFHRSADVVKTELNLHLMWEDFADISKVRNFLRTHLGASYSKQIKESVAFAQQLLRQLRARIKERHRQGFTIDGHGDLHSKNILLLEEPVIFDCIEFNDHFRQLDVLSELAFFCMDLNFYGRSDLEAHFLKCYIPRNPCLLEKEDHLLFQYYKMYRANVRLKVNTLKAMQTDEKEDLDMHLKLADDYFRLMMGYMAEMPSP